MHKLVESNRAIHIQTILNQTNLHVIANSGHSTSIIHELKQA